MKIVVVVALALGLAALAKFAADAAPQAQNPQSWRTCCGASPWPQGSGMMGGGMMGGSMMGGGTMGGGMTGGSLARHRVAMQGGVPAPYASESNPLPRTAATIDHGAGVYAANCASCHGASGLGDGAVAKSLTPRPANLAWLSNMPTSRWDPFMYWTVAEGGVRFGTGMPAFKGSLSKGDIWAVIAYIQAHLPQAKAAR
jgi:mono/diheme cytochrome c family protein